MNTDAVKEKPRKSQSKILWEITILVLAVFIIAIASIGLVFNNYAHKLIEKSKKDLISTQAKTTSAAFDSLGDILNSIFSQKFTSGDTAAEFTRGILTKTINRASTEASAILKSIVKQGFVGDGYLIVVVPEFPPVIKEPTIFVSSKDKLMFKGVPESVYSILESDKPYGLIEDGVPEWGLKGEQLVISRKMDTAYTGGLTVYAVGIKPIQGDIDRVYQTYNKENNSIRIMIGIVSALSLVFLFLITFFVLRYLISSKITRPIDELSAAAEQVMEGDLDVEVPVREGEEFENLKRAFNEMLKSLRSLFTRATGDGE